MIGSSLGEVTPLDARTELAPLPPRQEGGDEHDHRQTAVITGQTSAVTERAPETPSSARLRTGFPPPPVVTVETGRPFDRPAPRVRPRPHRDGEAGTHAERGRGGERQHAPDDRRDHGADEMQHMVDDRHLVADEVRQPDHADDPQYERVTEVVPRGRQVDQVRVAVQQADGEQRDVGIETGGRREPESSEVASESPT
jgi:hypothetical protein